jgi:hypothetical protein
MKYLNLVLIIAFFCVFSLNVVAQPCPPGGCGDPDPSLPFDGGSLILLASGALLGARKVYQSRK